MRTQYFLEHTHNVLLVVFGATLTEQTVAAMDDDIRTFIKTHGRCRGILDLQRVTRVDLSPGFILRRSRTHLLGDRRVLVAPDDHVFGMLRMFQFHQRELFEEPTLVRTMEEAYITLALTSLNFRPIEIVAVRAEDDPPVCHMSGID